MQNDDERGEAGGEGRTRSGTVEFGLERLDEHPFLLRAALRKKEDQLCSGKEDGEGVHVVAEMGLKDVDRLARDHGDDLVLVVDCEKNR
jgi:hypothetical protein